MELISPDVDFLLFNDINTLWTVSVSVLVNSKELPGKMSLILIILGWSEYLEIVSQTGSSVFWPKFWGHS